MTRLALLWHMHQPYYEDLATGEHILPWVRLHAIKDYLGMVELLAEFPAVRLTFNLVPSLLVQIQAFAEGRASDRHLTIGLKPADELSSEERAFLVANGFHAPYDRMIRPFRRYAELHARRLQPDAFTSDDLRDLQVWHKVVWTDPDWLARDPRLQRLVAKERGFSEADKATLHAVEREIIGRVIPAYREAAARGQIELSTSPFYHPILPLLCDTDVHFRAHPQSALPPGLFRWPGDATEQLRRAIALHTSLFGGAPQGVWPSEGSVSDEALRAIAECGVSWAASDEAILARSLNRAADASTLYRPYSFAGTPLRCLFRDHALSDLIGFSYQSWDAESAASDFVARVREAGLRFGGGEEATITVVLDGENAWEHYPGGGRPFLRALYRSLAEAPDIATVTMAEAAAAPTAGSLPSVFPGSWINADFYIWAGHRDDHRAWAQLAAARRAFERRAADLAPEVGAHAFEELCIAEGSDWFWWYGDDHSSEHDREFDDLFRRHLRNVYRALGEAVPDELHVSNISTAASPAGPLPIRTLIHPTLDGRLTGFAEWAGATPIALGGGARTMHRVTTQLVERLLVGAGGAELFIRLDGARLASLVAAGELGISILIGNGENPRRLDLTVSAFEGPRVRAAEIVEAVVPFERLGLSASSGGVRFSVLITDARGFVIEQHPAAEPVDFRAPEPSFALRNWVI